ncbi:MAG: ABC transporter permease subunit [Planctomycetota bacterium]|jgi:ABC-type transport system involved in multi-copper enzyme maturation permease subunit
MKSLLPLYRRLDLVQRRRWFKIAMVVLALIVCGGSFGSLIATSHRIDAQRRSLMVALDGQNLADEDELAVTLHETGTVEVDGRVYGGPHLVDPPEPIFDGDGNIIAPPILIERLVADQRPDWAPRWLLEQPATTWMLGGIMLAWLLLIVVMEITLPFALTVVATAVPAAVCIALGNEQATLGVVGIGLLTFTFVLLTRLALLAYSYPSQVLAVAHTVIKEASRTRVSLVFIVLLLVLLPLLPLWLDPDAPLRFRVQTYISRSLGLTFAIAGCMTVILACATVAFEIRDRQIWQLMTKPLSRVSYLAGKWLGVVTINLILLLIAGVSTFGFIQYLRTTPVASGRQGLLDIMQLQEEVLTARLGTPPRLDELSDEQLRERLRQRIERDPELARQEQIPLSLQYELQAMIRENHLTGQRSVAPQTERTFTFTGLERARGQRSAISLRYRFFILRNSPHETYPAAFYFNGRPETAVRRTFVPTMSHVLLLNPALIREDGTLDVTIANLYQPTPDEQGFGALNFEEDGLELLYRAGTFESNFLRAVLIAWIKLAFLAALGIGCATLLSFPVAVLTSFTVFIAGALAPFLQLSLEEYYPPDAAQMDWGNVALVIQWAFRSVIRALAQTLVFVLGGFGEYRPMQSLVEGRLIAWADVTWGLVRLTLLWSGLALLFGYLVMRSRQLAIYSGQG